MSRNLHDDDLRLRCPGCAKVFKTREAVANHVRSSLHGEWITDFSIPPSDSEDSAERAA